MAVPTSVSLVVVNYNGLRWIDACLESVFAQTRPAQEVWVVDNASSDAEVGHIRSRWPQVRLIPLSSNVGYAAACNLGIRASQGELVAVLNNDISLSPTWLQSLLEHVEEPWSFWASRILFASDPQRVDSAGDAMAVVGAAYKIGHGRPARDYEEPREVFGPCAAAALYRRSLLEEAGGFDDDFFLVYEDADLSMRARLLGHRCLYVPQAQVLHHVNSSIGTLSDTYVFYGHRNSEYLFWKNMPLAFLLLYLPERLLFNLFSWVYFTARGKGGAFLRSKKDFLLNWKGLAGKRLAIQSGRKVGLRELRAALTRNWFKGRVRPRVAS